MKVVALCVVLAAGFAAVLALAVVLWNHGFIDTYPRRKAAADRIRLLKAAYLSNPANLSPVREIETAASSTYPFEARYAMGTLGELGEGARDSVPLIAEGLRSEDPFIRRVAAESLRDLGPIARPAKDALLEVIRKHEGSGAAANAAEALGNIGDPSDDVIDVLKSAMHSYNSILAKDAKAAYEKLTANDKPPD